MTSRLDAFVKSIIFPRPKIATYDTSTHPNKLVHIPLVDPHRHVENGAFTYGYLLINPKATHVFLYAHPNAVDIGVAYKELRYVSKEASISVLLFEYSGYGLTHTPITEASIHQDTLSAYLFLRRYVGVPANRVIFCGRSLGASPAAFLAALLPPTQRPCLLILQCPFTALSECINEFSQNAVSIANFLGYNWFRTIDIIADVSCPVVLHHGTHDTIVRIDHSYTLKRVRDTAPKPCVTYVYQEDGKGHNNLSFATLVRILRERVVTEALLPLSVPHLKVFLANAPVYQHLFCDSSGIGFATLNDAVLSWRAKLSFHLCAPPLDQLYVLLTASVCVFTMKCARAWQIYCSLIRKNLCREAVHERCTKDAFLHRCLACWGNPLAVHVDVESVNSTREVHCFGFATCRDGLLDAPALYPAKSTEALLSVLEIGVTPGLLSCMKRCLATAPGMLEEGDIPCFVHQDTVNAVQLECERAVAFLSEDDKQRLCAFLKHMDSGFSENLSSKAYERLRRSTSSCSQMSSESFQELKEWLRPWASTSGTDMHALAHEVPWDDYLLRGRLVARQHVLSESMSWEECCQAMEESEVVYKIYNLFQDMSAQYLRPAFLTAAAVASRG
ncbi:serine peptidase, putative [Leishmania tarentolae]|uniref:Serine peptidase, putative n=1 Tax=Leishmania tarentolae TaxID=5689 RepID=A0A640KCS9_LEITA|nr:serine peptidase, putative [Leishmania tarentolae]